MKLVITPQSDLVEHIAFCFTSLDDLKFTLTSMGWYDDAAAILVLKDKMAKLFLKDMEELSKISKLFPKWTPVETKKV